jgi:hypothetical protein
VALLGVKLGEPLVLVEAAGVDIPKRAEVHPTRNRSASHDTVLLFRMLF